MLQYFSFEHLPPGLAAQGRKFADLAVDLATTLDPSQELTVALRKLLEAKDAAVRATKPGDPQSVANDVIRSVTTDGARDA